MSAQPWRAHISASIGKIANITKYKLNKSAKLKKYDFAKGILQYQKMGGPNQGGWGQNQVKAVTLALSPTPHYHKRKKQNKNATN